MKHFIVTIIALIAASPCSAQWLTNTQSDKAFVFGVHDTTLFASFWDGSTGIYYVARYVPTGSAFEKWSEADGGINLTNAYVTMFTSLGNYFYAGRNGNATTYETTDNGSTWSGLKAGSPIATNGTYLYGTDNFTGANPMIRCSHDTGKTWVELDSLAVQSFGCNGACIFAATPYSCWRSLDSGSANTWAVDTTPISNIQSFTFIGSIIFALNGSGAVIKSTDSGKSWTAISIPKCTIAALADSGRYLFAGTDSGVFISLDSGSNWRAVSAGLGKYLKVNALGVFDTFLFVSAASGGNWYTGFRPIREMTDTTSKSAVVAASQPGDTLSIYPNPAAGVVTILSGVAIQHVSVMDVLGEDVLDMPNLRESEINIDISKLPSGTYFLRIQTEVGNVIRKIVKEE